MKNVCLLTVTAAVMIVALTGCKKDDDQTTNKAPPARIDCNQYKDTLATFEKQCGIGIRKGDQQFVPSPEKSWLGVPK